ncbi:hypothetical protein SAMN05216436_13129 [bacterium A37T11]|nr:hypothetical protein SAMN05216436_13129 [bacterium A37T11]
MAVPSLTDRTKLSNPKNISRMLIGYKRFIRIYPDIIGYIQYSFPKGR